MDFLIDEASGLDYRKKITTFQSSPNAGKGATIKCELCGFEKINDYPLTKKCTVRKKHKWKEIDFTSKDKGDVNDEKCI